MSTSSSPLSRSARSAKLTVLRRNGSPPAAVAVDSALARFSAVTRSRADWARIPAAAMVMALLRSIGPLPRGHTSGRRSRLRHPDGGPHHPNVAAVQTSGQLMVELGGRHLAHLLRQFDPVARGRGLVVGVGPVKKRLPPRPRPRRGGGGRGG